MKTIEIFELIKKNKACNFVATCSSVLQINGVNAAVAYLMDKGVKLNGYIIIQKSSTFQEVHYQNKLNIRVDGIEYIYGPILFTDLHFGERIKCFLEAILVIRNRKHRDRFYVIRDSFSFHWIRLLRRACGPKRIVFCEIDDGIANYRVTKKDMLLAASREDNRLSFIVHSIKFCIKQMLASWLVPYLVKGKDYIDCKAMKESGTSIVANRQVVHYWMNSFRENAIDIDESEIHQIEGNILILGTNDDERVFEIIQSIIHTVVCVSVHYDVKTYLKPHPRDINVDRYERLGCKLINIRQVAMEEILAILKKKPLCIIGYGSTVLVTGKVLYGIPTISCTSIVKGNDRYSRYVNEAFERRFGDTVQCPASIDELGSMLKMAVTRKSGEG